ncbi:tyrosine-type recombinase/integrase [Chryseomicrobium aureum]|uniref:tyrosine-type recombinase/integrase n=1 Tax=Chryseomicrobium aureum TaxID=1441723 RepID=UPI00370DAD43
MGHYQELGEGRYRLFVDNGKDRKGKRKRKTKIVHASGVRELKYLLRQFENEVENHKEDDTRRISFEEFVTMWKKNYMQTELELSTQQTYNGLLKFITPFFNEMDMDQIKTIDIVNYFTSEKENERRSLEKKYNVLLSLFSKAFDWGVIESNPMQGVKKPKTKPKKKQPYTWEEVQELSRHMADLSPYHQRLIKITVECALRRGEVLGIAEDVLDFENNRILIRRSLGYTKENGLYLKCTKTEDETYLHVSQQLMDELKKQLLVAKKNRIKNSTNWLGFRDREGIDVLLLFADEFGVPHQPNAVTRFWGRFIERKSLRPISFHDLRHSSASILNRKGVRSKSLQNRLRHKNIKTTMNLYVHEEDNDDKLVAQMFDGIWSS